MRQSRPITLSPQELVVLKWLAEGLTNRKIAEKMRLSPNTVREYTRNVYSKLGASNRAHAVAIYDKIKPR